MTENKRINIDNNKSEQKTVAMLTLGWDVVGYDNKDNITLIEVKASFEDFIRDIKWRNYLSYCNNFYFIFSKRIYDAYEANIMEALKSTPAGILIAHKNRLEKIKDSESDEIPNGASNIIFLINRNLSKKVIYGY